MALQNILLQEDRLAMSSPDLYLWVTHELQWCGDPGGVPWVPVAEQNSFWEEVSRQDTYLTSEECLEYGIVDEIT